MLFNGSGQAQVSPRKLSYVPLFEGMGFPPHPIPVLSVGWLHLFPGGHPSTYSVEAVMHQGKVFPSTVQACDVHIGSTFIPILLTSPLTASRVCMHPIVAR